MSSVQSTAKPTPRSRASEDQSRRGEARKSVSKRKATVSKQPETVRIVLPKQHVDSLLEFGSQHGLTDVASALGLLLKHGAPRVNQALERPTQPIFQPLPTYATESQLLPPTHQHLSSVANSYNPSPEKLQPSAKNQK